MKCADGCGYYWQDEDEDYPRCHFEGWTAPCEYGYEEEEEEDYEEG